MRRRVPYLVIGALLGIVVMQWAMPSGRATIITEAAGRIVAMSDDYLLDDSGTFWQYDRGSLVWHNQGSIPVPLSEVRFFSFLSGAPYILIVDEAGDLWQRSKSANGQWQNLGQPPFPVGTPDRTWGSIKNRHER